MQLNIFGFKMFDSKGLGEVYASDITDIIQNALAACPDAAQERTYLDLVGVQHKRF